MNWFSKRLISWYCSHCDTHLTKNPHSILEILMEIHSTFTWLIYWKVNKDTPLLLQLRLYALLNTDTSIYWFLSLIVVLQEMKWNESVKFNNWYTFTQILTYSRHHPSSDHIRHTQGQQQHWDDWSCQFTNDELEINIANPVCINLRRKLTVIILCKYV